jgi:hypothetical protein
MELARTFVFVSAFVAMTLIAAMFVNFYQDGAQAQNETSAQPENITTSSLPAEELASITPQAGVSAPLGPAHIKIVSTCKLNNISCASAQDKILLVQPFIFTGNTLNRLGDGFPASQFGRIIDVPVQEDSPTQYVIKQDNLNSNLFNSVTSYSYDCENQIQPGENKVCNIDTTLYLR